MYEFNHFNRRQRFWFYFFQTADHFFGRAAVQKVLSKQRHRLFLSIMKSLRKKGPGKTYHVDRRENLSAEEFKREYLDKDRPVILSGAAKEWACTKNWSFEYLKEHYGDDKILIVNTDESDTPHEELTLSEALKKLKNGNKNYIRFYNLLRKHSERIADFDYTWMRSLRHEKCFSETWQVFIGGKDQFTRMHNAPACNLFVMAHGSKKWIMYPMYFNPIIEPSATQSGVYRATPVRNGGPFNPFFPDYEGHPPYRYIDRYIVELEEGDVFFNPAYWWHTVRNESDSIGIGYRWINVRYNLRHNPLYTLLDFTARNPSFFKSVKLWDSTVNKVFLAEQKRLSKKIDEEV